LNCRQTETSVNFENIHNERICEQLNKVLHNFKFSFEKKEDVSKTRNNDSTSV